MQRSPLLETPWICTMIGARQHYALPLALHQAGALARLYTDIWAGPLFRRTVVRLPYLSAAGTRYHPGIPRSAVVGFTMPSIRRRLGELACSNNTASMEELFLAYVRQGRDFSQRVN